VDRQTVSAKPAGLPWAMGIPLLCNAVELLGHGENRCAQTWSDTGGYYVRYLL